MHQYQSGNTGLIKVALAAGLAALSFSAAAAPVTLSFTARVTDVAAVLGGAAVPGQNLNGAFTYESNTPDSAADPLSGVYFDAGVLRILNLGALSWSGSQLQLLLTNRPNQDIYVAEFGRTTGSAIRDGSFDYVLDRVTLSLTDSSGTALSSDRLGTSGPALSGFSVRSVSMVFVNQRGLVAQIVGDVTSLTTNVNAVPAPATAWLVLAGLAALGSARRWGSRPKH
jgi:hypothetical protein